MSAQRLLLDTHAFLWAVLDPEKLGGEVKRLITDSNITVMVSVISVWEIGMKSRSGKLQLHESAENLDAWISKAVRSLDAAVLPLRLRHVFAFYRVPVHHKDAMDRMLVAQARTEKAMLATCDAAIRGNYEVDIVW